MLTRIAMICVPVLCCFPLPPHHQTYACKACEHDTEEVDQVRAGAAGGGKLVSGVIGDGQRINFCFLIVADAFIALRQSAVALDICNP